jgi:hypothetical protein
MLKSGTENMYRPYQIIRGLFLGYVVEQYAGIEAHTHCSPMPTIYVHGHGHIVQYLTSISDVGLQDTSIFVGSYL